MSKSRGIRTGPARAVRKIRKRKSGQPILSAEQVLAGMRLDIGAKLRIVVNYLSKQALTISELVYRLRQDPNYPTSGQSDERTIKRLHDLILAARRPIFGNDHGRWYVKQTLADPQFSRFLPQPETARPEAVPVFLLTGRNRLRSIVFDTLNQEGKLLLGQIMERVKEREGYQGTDDDILRRDIWNVLYKNERRKTGLFQKAADQRGIIPKHHVAWEIVPGAKLPVPKKLQPQVRRKKIPKPYFRPPKQRDALYVIMASKRRISGWSLNELCQEIMSAGTGYQFDRTAGLRQLKIEVNDHLRQKREHRFQRWGQIGDFRWRAVWLGKIKQPANVGDFQQLIGCITSDLGEMPDYEQLVEVIKTGGHLFGWDVLALPAAFLHNNVVAALERGFGVVVEAKVGSTSQIDENDEDEEGNERPLLGEEGVLEMLEGFDLPEI